ncbi:hypothetical protein LCGC14_2762420, partial [marine sediment metagenome]
YEPAGEEDFEDQPYLVKEAHPYAIGGHRVCCPGFLDQFRVLVEIDGEEFAGKGLVSALHEDRFSVKEFYLGADVKPSKALVPYDMVQALGVKDALDKSQLHLVCRMQQLNVSCVAVH